jgi:hypothetical protein
VRLAAGAVALGAAAAAAGGLIRRQSL